LEAELNEEEKYAMDEQWKKLVQDIVRIEQRSRRNRLRLVQSESDNALSRET
jgi:hypothetical protein